MDVAKRGIGSPYQVAACCSSESHDGVNATERLKRACQAETSVIQTVAPTQLLCHTKDELTEEGHFDTLVVQTETGTQFISNEEQQDTQLIGMDGCTLVIQSDGEGSGDTEVLLDDDEPGLTSRAGLLSDGNGQYLADPEATSALASSKHTDGELEKGEECKIGCDSDATTEEVNAEDADDLGGAESAPHDGQRLIEEGSLHSNVAQQNTHIIPEIEIAPSEKAFEEIEQGFRAAVSEGHTSQGDLCSMQTPSATLVHDVTNNLSPNMSVLRSRSGSIASVRAASLRASGLQAAARNLLTAHGGNDNMDKYDSDSSIELTPELDGNLLPSSKALREKKTSRDLMASVSVSFESITPDMKKPKSQTEFVSHTNQQHDAASPISKAVVEGPAFGGEKSELKSHCRKPHGQKVRKLSFESNKISDKTPPSEAEQNLAVSNKDIDGASPATNALGIGEGGDDILPKKSVESTHGPRRELSRNLIQHSSLPSGSIPASTKLSYLESQEPGEESQLNALNVIDKLVWLNATEISQDSEPNVVSQQNFVKASQKAVQSLAHTVEIKNIQDKMGVYDWVDSQQDDIGFPSDAKGDSSPRRKQPGKGRKRQAASQQNNIASRFRGVKKHDDTTVNKESATLAFGQKVQSNMEASSKQNQGMEPQTLQAGQNRGRRRKGGTGQFQKEENTFGLEKCKHGENNKPMKGSSKLIEHGASIDLGPSHAADYEKLKLQHAIENTQKGEKESRLGSHIGTNTRMAQEEAIDMFRDGLATHDVSAGKKGKRRGKADAKSGQTKSPNCSNVKETIQTKEGVVKDSADQEMTGYQTRSGKRESTTVSNTKGGKRVSWDPLNEHQINNEKEENMIKEELVKSRHTKSKAQDVANLLADVRTDEPCKAQTVKNYDGNSNRRSKMQGTKQDNTSLSYRQLRSADSNVVSLGKQSVRKHGLKMKKGYVTQQQPTVNIGQEDTVNEVQKDRKKSYNSSTSAASDDGQEGSPLHHSINKKDNKRKREAANKSPSDVVDTPKLQAQKCLPKLGASTGSTLQMELACHVSGPSVQRKRVASLCAPNSKGRNTRAAAEEEMKSVPHNLKNRVPNQKDNDTEREFAVPAIRTTKANKRKLIRQPKKIASPKPLSESGFSLILEEGRKRKRERGCICVLFSHSLSEETCKNQKKILAKLGGHVAMSATDCTHFVIDCFVRTRNMLESMAAGKLVVTSLWLRNCGQAHYFVDEKNYILRDAKKEKELGFSMHSSLAAAQRKLILQGLKLLISPKTTPDQEAMTAIIQSAGGQVVESMPSLARNDLILNGNVLIVIASEEDNEFCLPFVERGFKVYSTELILSGIVSQNLDFSRNQLFDCHGQQKRSSRGASTLQV